MTPAALLLVAVLLRPGDLITIQAKCQTDEGSTTRAGCRIVIKSPIYRKTPIFLAQGWKRSNHMADGMLVRAFVKSGTGTKLIDGIQMSDGRVWADDHPYERADSPPPATVATSKAEPAQEPPDKPSAPPEKEPADNGE